MPERKLSNWVAIAEIISAAAVDLASLLTKGYSNPGQLSPDEALRFQNYNELLYVAWERAYMTNEVGVFSDELFDAWNGWFISIAQSNPKFVWPMVRDSQGWNPPFVEHVDQSLGYPKSVSRGD